MTVRTWRTPGVILTCGGIALTIALGVRHNFGLYLQPMTVDLDCTGFSIVFGVVGRSVPAERRTVALGVIGAAGSFGQFIMLPYGQTLISAFGGIRRSSYSR